MSYSSHDTRRSYHSGSRPNRNQGQRNQGPRPAYIHPSRYVNKAAVEQEPIVVDIKNNFVDFGLDEQLLNNVRKHGYTTPTPIQDEAIPAMMAGRDVVGLAQTGSGKTAAFLLPLINKVLSNKEEGVLIVVPTRELATQIKDELTMFIRGFRISYAVCVGGLSIDPQIRSLRENPHFVIGTPGRLKDLINRGAVDLGMYGNIVLDEVDRMLDIGFIHDIRFLIDHLAADRHSYFFSATMPQEVRSVMQAFLKDPVTISVQATLTSDHIHQDIIRVQPGQNKIDVLHDLLTQEAFERVIVFGRTKHGIDKLERNLSDRGIRVSSIHGNKTQAARQKALDMFKAGRVQALLATDVAARGIDIDDVTHVINYDEPGSYEDYIHRIGRTGRAGKVGKALTFVL